MFSRLFALIKDQNHFGLDFSHNVTLQQDTLDMHCFKLKQNGNNLW